MLLGCNLLLLRNKAFPVTSSGLWCRDDFNLMENLLRLNEIRQFSFCIFRNIWTYSTHSIVFIVTSVKMDLGDKRIIASRGLLGCDTVYWCGRISPFRRIILPPATGWGDRGFGILPYHHTASQAGRPRHECLPPWTSQIWHQYHFRLLSVSGSGYKDFLSLSSRSLKSSFHPFEVSFTVGNLRCIFLYIQNTKCI
jgi:hypothetical protein